MIKPPNQNATVMTLMVDRYRFIFLITLCVLALMVLTWPSRVVAQDEDLFVFEHVSCQGQPHEIRLAVTNVKESTGLMTAELYADNPDVFLKKEGRIAQVKFAARAPVTQFCMVAPNAGEFAMAVYHDENANSKFDKGTFGIPVEPWGLSNDPKIRFSAPPVSKTLFTVSETGTSVKIKLRNR